MDDVWRYLLATGFPILMVSIAMFFSHCEIAIISLPESRLRRLSEEGNNKAKRLLSFKEDEFDFSLLMQTCVHICIIVSCAVSMYYFTRFVLSFIISIYAILINSRTDMINLSDHSFLIPIAIFLTFAISALISILIGVTIPQKLALKNPEKAALSCVPLLSTLLVLFKPFTFLIYKTTRGFLRLIKVNPDLQTADITEDEIRMLVDEGNENGTIEQSEREMINNIFEFDDREVFDVMTHRTEISAVSKNDCLEKVLALALNEGFSRIPVYGNDIDNIVGLLYVKDLLSLLGEMALPKKTAADYMRSVLYIPESTRCRMLFKEFKEKKTHMAVVVDEYGGTSGIVTMEDLLESIVGNIQDEYDSEDEDMEKIDDNTYILQGSIAVDEVEELFGFCLPDEVESDTLGGLILNTLGRIPEENETPSVTICSVIFTVNKVCDRRIVSVKAQRTEQGFEEFAPANDSTNPTDDADSTDSTHKKNKTN